MTNGEEQGRPSSPGAEGISRRDAMKKAAVGAATVAWAAPAVQSMTQVPAFAQGTPVCPDLSTTTETVTGVVNLSISNLMTTAGGAYGGTVCSTLTAGISGGVEFAQEADITHRIETENGDTSCATSVFYVDFCDAFNAALALAQDEIMMAGLMLTSFSLSFDIVIGVCAPRGNNSLTVATLQPGTVVCSTNGASGCGTFDPTVGTGDVTISGNTVNLDLDPFSASGLSPIALCECQYTLTACYTVTATNPPDTVMEAGTPSVTGTFGTGVGTAVGSCNATANVTAACWAGGPQTGTDASGNPIYTPGDPMVQVNLVNCP